ncbi:MAG: DUF4336 domain-containing protein [Myxococcota bacterium]
MLEPLAEGLWHDHFDLFMPGRVHFRGRMVVARLGSGGLWVWSPIPISDELAAQLAELGPVEHLVAPNGFHHMHFEGAAERYGSARKWISPALVTKRPDLAHDELLTTEAPPAWAQEFDQHLIGGMPKVDEFVFLHRPSKSLLVTDMVFNILEYQGWVSGLVFRMAGTHKRFAQSRLFRSFVKDRAAAAHSARHILGWDFERVVMAHGEIVEQGARETLEGALGWMLAGAPSSDPAAA